jgi:MADS-box transcription factor
LNGFNFTTPVVGTGPSFLRDDATIPGIGKRKSPEANAHGPGDNHDLAHEPKRVKVE